ncbi:MAG: hypothetical protein KHX07_07170 [Peptostreptococcus sp.]|nr:hypothetical protein [Peptostreptococcus sp.]
MDRNILNASGCKDLTAYEAIKKADKDIKSEERFNKLLTAIFTVCEISDFHLESRIVVKDKRTGKIWR